jgi:hypothetical protein
MKKLIAIVLTILIVPVSSASAMRVPVKLTVQQMEERAQRELARTGFVCSTAKSSLDCVRLSYADRINGRPIPWCSSVNPADKKVQAMICRTK